MTKTKQDRLIELAERMETMDRDIRARQLPLIAHLNLPPKDRVEYDIALAKARLAQERASARYQELLDELIREEVPSED